jgi:hypothetical protein
MIIYSHPDEYKGMVQGEVLSKGKTEVYKEKFSIRYTDEHMYILPQNDT